MRHDAVCYIFTQTKPLNFQLSTGTYATLLALSAHQKSLNIGKKFSKFLCVHLHRYELGEYHFIYDAQTGMHSTVMANSYRMHSTTAHNRMRKFPFTDAGCLSFVRRPEEILSYLFVFIKCKQKAHCMR